MDSMAKWNVIVDQFNAHKESKENEIQNLWENIFSQVFDYSKMLGFLDAQKSYQIGNSGSIKPDIMLKNSTGPICVVELKQEEVTLTDKIEGQLFSYLKMTKIDTGIIIADKIYLYAYEYKKKDSEQSSISISFEKDNKEGELFIDLLTQDSFDSNKIADFVNEKINHLNNVAKIKSDLNKQTVLEALDNYLGNKYKQEEINEALNSFEIIINEKKKEANKMVDTPKDKSVSIEEAPLLESKVELHLDADKILKGGKAVSIYLRKELIKAKYFTEDWKSTVAKLNKDGRRFWANPSIDFLNYDWCLVLNDITKRELLVFKIPANSIEKESVKTRIHDGKTLIDLEIVRQNDEYVCLTSKIQYNKWYVETIKY